MRMFTALLSSYGASAGINFKFGGTMANSLDAHRVLQHFQQEKGPEVANALLDELYKLYFEEEQSPSSESTLLRACAAAGIDQGAAEKVVSDKTDGLSDTKRMIEAQTMDGVDAVPYIVIEGKRRDITLVGAKETPEYVRALQTIARESK